MIALLFCLLSQDPSAPTATARPQGIELPVGPAGRAWSTLSSMPPVQQAAFDGVNAGQKAWSLDETWKHWSDALEREATAAEPDGSRRALLATAAWSQGRSDDAWDHFAALSSQPQWMTAALPFLCPGVREFAIVDGHLRVEDGAILAPALPPPSVPAREVVLGMGRIERRAMTISGLQIGEATVDLRVGLEYEGLQIDVTHKSGSAAKVSFKLPTPLDFDIATVYVDWQRREGPTDAPVALELAPGSEPRTVFARFTPVEIRWPTIVPEALDSRAKEHGFVLSVRDGDPERARIAGFASAMSRLLGVPARVDTPDAALRAAPAIVLDLSDAPDRERKLRGLISQCERFALARKKP